MSNSAIMLGGNLPGSENAMAAAITELEKNGFSVGKISSIFHSAAVDCVPGTPDFIDQAVIGCWNGTPEELLSLCQKIEISSGRPAIHSSRESRILDLDIILFDQMEINTPRLTIPHPRARIREFVLAPLAEIAPEWTFPDGSTISSALAALQGTQLP
ncbi:MAG: 2-amino-4-hydroxy-6-hydroxymethyldihydropteridine diphosphokinase [Lentisphaeria bacterium]|nr:2-amino-4-hydroxy-6-hydroxymethyldihydropteridine diphosphokinase [Lentisphaeria bacterium]